MTATADGPSPMIFVVDDDEMVRDSLKILLESRNFSVIEFESARAFLDRHDGSPARCLIVDVHMPEMTGLELLKELRGHGNNIPVILITGRRDSSVQAQAQALGVTLLDKPVAHRALFSAIEQAFSASPN